MVSKPVGDSSGRLDIDPERRAWRGSLFALGIAAVLSALVAIVLVVLWQNYVKSLQPDYFRAQALEWGRDIQSRIEEKIRLFDATADPARIEGWREELPKYFSQVFSEELSRNSAVVELSMQIRDREGRFRTAARLGTALKEFPAAVEFTEPDPDGLAVAVIRLKPQPLLVLDGPLVLDPKDAAFAWAKDELQFHAVLQFLAFQDVSERGTTYAAIMVIVYLGILYVILFIVFVQGRKQMLLSFSAQEKSIRLNAISSVAEGIAHEVRNPLNAVSLNVQYIEKLAAKGHAPEGKDYQRVYRELGKIRKVIDNFVNFAKLRDLEVSDWSLDEALDQSLAILGPKIMEHQITIERDQSGNLDLAGDRPKIVSVISGVLDNAIASVRETEAPRIDIHLAGDANTVTLSIRDHGKSPDDEVIKNIFDPYFTTRSSSMGLGLTLAKTVVQSHGGRIAALAAPGGGMVVTMTLPRDF